jgi:hypothetical protein
VFLSFKTDLLSRMKSHSVLIHPLFPLQGHGRASNVFDGVRV